jgi:hypothetical protein
MPKRPLLQPIRVDESSGRELINATKQRIYGHTLARQSGPKIAAEEGLNVNIVNKAIACTST